MQRDLVALACIVAFGALIAFVVISVRRKQAGFEKQQPLADLAALSGAVITALNATYVSTVFANSPLKRILTHGLMYRGHCQITVRADGLAISRQGEASFSISRGALVEIARASATIDKGVETDGLLAVTWNLGSTLVTSNFRVRADQDTPELFAVLQNLRIEGQKV